MALAVTIPVVAVLPLIVAGEPATAQLAPLTGGVKVTCPPLTGSPAPLAVTVTESGLANAVLIALCIHVGLWWSIGMYATNVVVCLWSFRRWGRTS